MDKKLVRFISIALVIVLLLGVVPAVVFAADEVASVTIDGVTTNYATVQEAVDVASAAGGTVKLLCDVALPAQVELTSGVVTIDLAGHRLEYSIYADNNVLHVDGAEVTVTDSSAAKTGTLAPNGSSIYNSGVYIDSGKVTVAGVICDGGQRAVTVAGGTAIIDDITTDEDVCISGGTLTVNGGSMEQLDMSGGETVVNGGYFSTTSGITYLIYLNGGKITVNGGIWRFCDNYGIRFNNGNSDCFIRGGVYTNGLKMSCAYGSGLDMYLPDILGAGYYLYDDAGEQISISYDTKKVAGYVAVAQTSPGVRVYNVKYSLTGLTSSSTATTIKKGYSLFVTFTAEEGYTAPDSITVKVDGKVLSASNYAYSDGFLRLMSDKITGDLEIIAKAVEQWTYRVVGISGYDDHTMTETDGVYTKTYTALPAGTDYEISVEGSSISDSSKSESVVFDVTQTCDVTVSYDRATGEITVTGDYVEQEVLTHRVIYFDNSSKKWSKVNIYAWNDAGSVTGGWPGTAMTLLEGDIYYYVLPIEAVNVIFNDGSSQTGDLTLPDLSLNMYDASGKWVYFDGDVCTHPSHGTDGKCLDCGSYVDHTYVDGTCSCGAVKPETPVDPEEPEANERVVYFKNTAGWSTPYIYTWTTANGSTTNYTGAWPGKAMEKVEGEADLYRYTISVDAQNVIFHNNSGTQTDDLVLPTDGKDLYTYSTNSWTESLLKDECEHESHDKDGVCADCGETVEHTYSSVVTPPTCTAGGYTTHTCSVCGGSKIDSEVAATGHNYVDGICSVCGAADPDAVKQPTLTLKYPSLSFEGEVLYNIYFTGADMDSVVEMGMITFNERLTDGTIADAVDTIPGYSGSEGVYMVQSLGIPAKALGDTVFMKVYAKLSDGSYVYSDVAGYNAVAYAKSVLNGNNSDEMKALVVSMLNYGTEAQLYFKHNTDNLMNSFLTAEQQAMIPAYDGSLVDSVVTADDAKTVDFPRTASVFNTIYASVSFDGAFSINYYVLPNVPVDDGITFYYWDAETYATAEKLTAENAIGSVTMTYTDAQTPYWACVPNIAAKYMDTTYYAAGVFESEGVTYTTGVISYSLGRYCESVAAKDGNEQQALAKATAVYGWCAEEYFASI